MNKRLTRFFHLFQNKSVECSREVCPRINACKGIITKYKGQCCSICQESQGKDLFGEKENLCLQSLKKYE